MSPLEYEQLVKGVLLLVLVILPALTVTAAVGARFAARPIVDAIGRLRELSASQPAPPDPRIAVLEDEVRQLRDGFERLASAVEFDAQLRGGAAPRLPQA